MTTMTDRWQEIERIGARPAPTDLALNQFTRCAGPACLFELVARRYADNTPALQRVAFKDLSVVIAALCEHVQQRTSDEERVVLDKCVRVRNKLLHLELSRVTGQLKSFGLDLDEAAVWMVDLGDGTATKVSETSTANGRIQGWLLQSVANGAFERALRLFARGIHLVQWLRVKDLEEEA